MRYKCIALASQAYHILRHVSTCMVVLTRIFTATDTLWQSASRLANSPQV